MANKAVHLPVLNFGVTMRKDAWWAGPLVTGIVLVSFIVYATFRAFENNYFQADQLLSPFYSPFIPTGSWGIPFLSPAMLILPGPASFRLTCYYYRKAYYRSLVMDPPACAVGEKNKHKYNGETKLLLFQNLHRFAMYVAIVFIALLAHDAYKALWFVENGVMKFGIGVGTLVMTANVLLLAGYTFGCHSLRHLVGGSVDSYSTAPLGQLRLALWKGVTALNKNHMAFAWLSLFGVALTDVYIRCVATGVIRDIHLL